MYPFSICPSITPINLPAIHVAIYQLWEWVSYFMSREREGAQEAMGSPAIIKNKKFLVGAGIMVVEKTERYLGRKTEIFSIC
jgi:hypothetical protein